MVEWLFPFFWGGSSLPGNHDVVVKAAHSDIGKTICFEAGVDSLYPDLSEIICQEVIYFKNSSTNF